MTPPASPSFFQLYGPVLAASIALLGVVMTLIVTGMRERRGKRLERDNEYRSEARSSLSALLTAGKDFERLGTVMADPARWVQSGYERASALADGTEEAMKDLQKGLITARLLIRESTLQDSLDELATSIDLVAEVIHEANDSFWESRLPGSVIKEAQARWDRYSDACGQVVKNAQLLLQPR